MERTAVEKGLEGSWRKMAGEGFSMNPDAQLQEANGVIGGLIYKQGSHVIRMVLREGYYNKGALDRVQESGAG